MRRGKSLKKSWGILKLSHNGVHCLSRAPELKERFSKELNDMMQR
jgi:hypothetical protein